MPRHNYDYGSVGGRPASPRRDRAPLVIEDAAACVKAKEGCPVTTDADQATPKYHRIPPASLVKMLLENPHGLCLLSLDTKEGYEGEHIIGSVLLNLSDRCTSLTQLEASIPYQDRIVFRAREFGEMVVVYAPNDTPAHRKLVGMACKLLKKDNMTNGVGYLTNYPEFVRRYPALIEGANPRCTATSTPSLSVLRNDSLTSAGSDSTDEYFDSGCVDVGSEVPSLEDRRKRAHELVFSNLTQSRTFTCPPPTEILPGLFLGNAQNAANRQQLLQLGVKTIINVSTEVGCLYPNDFRYLSHPVEDVPCEAHRLMRCFELCFQELDKACSTGAGVLVHCLVGASRSAAVIAAYLMRRRRLSVAESVAFLQSKRSIVRLNSGLEAMLHGYAVQLQDSTYMEETCIACTA